MTVQRKSIVLVLLSLSVLLLSCAPKGQKPVEQVSSEAIVSDSGACASGVDCSGADKICTETVNTCINEELWELCIVGERPSYEVCDGGLKCVHDECVDSCHNKALDEEEEAVDCGGPCDPCVHEWI